MEKAEATKGLHSQERQKTGERQPKSRDQGTRSRLTRAQRLSDQEESNVPSYDESEIESISARLSNGLSIGHERKMKRYIIAIDYGTTFSATAYAFVSESTSELNNLQVSHVRAYPSDGTLRSFDDQVPTVSLYSKREKRYEWGNGVYKALHDPQARISSTATEIRLVKLLLSESKEVQRYQEETKSRLDKCGISATKAIADFLQEMWKNATTRIALSDGEAFFESCQKDLVISVPPGWSPKAVREMQKAAELADLPEPEIVAEQEAAALCVLMDQRKRNRGNFQVGDIFIVVDAGGGTVDLAAYRLVQLDPFHVSEISNAEGATCGSSLLNQEFRTWFKKKLKNEEKKYGGSGSALFDRLSEAADRNFEWTKRSYDGTRAEDPYCEVPGLRKSRDGIFQNDTVVIPRDEMRSIFDRVIDGKIIPLITEQIMAIHEQFKEPVSVPLVKYIILVGGFSASAYLRGKIRSFFGVVTPESYPSYAIETRCPDEQHETTVARGSVLRALNPSFIRDRRLRTSYGIAQQEQFDQKKHSVRFKEQDEHEEKEVVNDCIYWGDKLAYDEQLKALNLTWTVDADYDFTCGNSREEFFCELYISDEKDPKDNQTILQMREQNLHLEKCCRLEADFSSADLSKLRPNTAKSGGKPYYKIPYNLKPSVLGVHTRWELVVPTVKGVVSWTQNINIAAAFKPGEAR